LQYTMENSDHGRSLRKILIFKSMVKNGQFQKFLKIIWVKVRLSYTVLVFVVQ